MKKIKIILSLLLLTTSLFSQLPRLRFTQIQQADTSGLVLASDNNYNISYSTQLRYIGSDLLFGGIKIPNLIDVKQLISDSIINKTNTDFSNVSGTLPIANGGTGSATQNFVDLTNAQTVGGAKTFTSDVEIDGKLNLNSTGLSIFIGEDAGRVDDGSSNQNVGVGYQSLYSNTEGSSNIAIGISSLYSNISGVANTAVGRRSLYENETGNNNMALGFDALYNNTASTNSAIGAYALRENINGQQNIADGSSALRGNISGSYNTALGNSAGRYYGTSTNDATKTDNSVFIGYDARPQLDSQTNQIVIGYGARGNGSNTITLGNSSIVSTHIKGKLDLNAPGNSVFIGEEAGNVDDGTNNFNVSVGYNALRYNTNGDNNVGLGYLSLRDNQGNNNLGVGSQSLQFNDNGNANVAIGTQAFLRTNSNNSVGIGYRVGRYYGAGSIDGVYQITNSVLIGYYARPQLDSQSNQIVIGYNTVGLGSNSVVLGNSSITKTRLQGDVGIGTDSPSADLDVVGDVEVNGNLTVTGTINNEPTYKQLSLGEGYADNIREFYYDNSITVHPSNLGYSYAELIKEDLLNEASLILTPTATSVGKLYTQKPLGITDAFDCVRNSTSTRVNSLGLIETVAANVPRIDYTDGEPSLLLEPSRTNLLTYSEDFSDAAWVSAINGSGVAPIITVNQEVAPDGTTTADKITFNSGGTASGDISLLTQTITLPNNTDGTISIYLKGAVGGEQLLIRGVAGSQYILINLTTSWVRYTTTENSGTTSDQLSFGIRQQVSGHGIINTTATVYAWGGQLEEGSYATSYIPTNGSTVTRAADVATNFGDTTIFNDSEGVLYAELSALVSAEGDRTIAISDGTTSNRVYLSYIAASNTVNAILVDGGSSQASISVSDIQTINSKLAIKYKANDVAFWVDGVEVGTDTSATMPNGLSELAFDDGGGSNPFYGNVKSIKYFPTALTDSELEALTQP